MSEKTVTDIISDSELQKLSYVIGALFGDGCFYLKDRGRIIFSSSDKEFTETVISYINSLFDLNITSRIDRLSLKNKEWSDAYLFSSRPLFRILKQFSNKEVPEFILNGNDLIKSSFMKGFFDAEGNVDVHIIKKRNETQRHVRCFNNDRNILEIIKKMLIALKIDSCITKGKGRNLCLVIWGYRSLVNFKDNIDFNINRKHESLKKAIESYKHIQMRWNRETYVKVMRLRGQNLGATLIQKELNIDIPKSTIESWIYRGAKTRG